MSIPSSVIQRSRGLAALSSAVADWSRTDGLAWIYMAKALLACYLAMGIAMRLDLPQPRTAMITVFIVMQPQSGMVLAKSFYRICATVVGLVVTLTLVSLFSQQPELFIASTAFWVGICTFGAARHRNFKSYGYVLAGYTTASIGIAAAQHPDTAFLGALTRVAEVSLGICCSGFVSALIFPRHADTQLSAATKDRFGAFARHASAALRARTDRAAFENGEALFVADVVRYESMRGAAVFESTDTRLRSRRLTRLNNELMTVSTRLHALRQLLSRLEAAGTAASTSALGHLEPHLHEIADLLDMAGQSVSKPHDAIRVDRELQTYQAALPWRLACTRAKLGSVSTESLLEFDTAAELLSRFVGDMQTYVGTYGSLVPDTHPREQWGERYEPKTNVIAAAAAGLRTALLTVLMGGFWFATAWPGGLTLMVDVSIISALIASVPDPKRMSYQMLIGAVLASVAGAILVFGVFPRIDGFPLLCAALAPFLLVGVYFTTRPTLAACGAGYLIFFAFLAGPDNLIRYEPVSFLNDALALVLGMVVATLSFAVLLPPSTRWLRNRLFVDLRRQVVHARRGFLGRVRSRFESGARDLVSQINALAPGEPELRQRAVSWLFLVLEIGNAMIDLRKDISVRGSAARFVSADGRDVLRVAMDRLAALFDAPRLDHFDRALEGTCDAMVVMQQIVATSEEGCERYRAQLALSQLHFIRTALLDRRSPFASFLSTRSGDSNGACHAA